ncbi:hypothetical protein H696_01591 [Fonticula alba]|uniref:Uncharacterized protein n=1 Tax=Fonticula alba TaxID=691883 RepID=A0A058ZCQ2_FONAL|nr:hypothetical protein H696_01591 [Fonticula alba]KCV72190.1 hypothetical protein H696_01591 [Fonticula alba]|eukprot:XP_009493768.1 hypothetical protein H696_01591 [Fonticula alba]
MSVAPSGPATDTGSHARQTLAALVSGGAASLVSCLLFQPLDLLKTRLQQPVPGALSPRPGNAPAGASAMAASGPRPPSSISQVSREILRTHGPAGFWRGSLATVLRTVPGSALYFGALRLGRSRLDALAAGALQPACSACLAADAPATGGLARSRRSWPATQQGAACVLCTRPVGPGALSVFLPEGALSDVLLRSSQQELDLALAFAARSTIAGLLNPVSVVKARFESNYYAYRSLGEAMRALLASEGPRGWLRGLGATVARDAPYSALYYSTYRSLQGASQHALAARDVDIPAPVRNFACGVAAGALATALTHPFDVVKTRAQLAPGAYPNSLRALLSLATAPDMGFLEVGRAAAGRLGLPGSVSGPAAQAYAICRTAFSGLAPRLARKSLQTALTWTLFEEITRLVNRLAASS